MRGTPKHFLTIENDREYAASRYRQRRFYAINKLGGKCSICKSIKNLEVHHKDPNSKEGNVFGKLWSTDRFYLELDKCILLCRECHNKQHYPERKHGTTTMYTHGKCRCDECKRAIKERMREYRSR